MRVAVGADHAGVGLKQHLADWLQGQGHEVVDFGTHSTEPVDYPDYAEAVGRAVLDGRAERGLIVCGSGVGACIAANKLPGYSRRALPRHLLGRPGRAARRRQRAGAWRARHRPGAGRGAGHLVSCRSIHQRRTPRAPAEQDQGARSPRVDAVGPDRAVMSLFDQLPQPLRGEVEAAATAWSAADSTGRLWAGDASLWTGTDESRWLGWLTAPADATAARPALEAFAAEVRADGFTDVLLLGMGGSSLCPEVLAESFGPQAGSPRLHVLDSTDPAQVAALERRVPLATTLVDRRQQVRLDTRAQHLQRLLLRAHGRRGRRGAGAPALRGDHRSRIEARGRGQARRLPAHLLRRVVDRRPVLGPVAVRPRAGRGDGPRPCALGRKRRDDGRAVRPAGCREQSRSRARPGDGNQRPARRRQAHGDRLAAHLRSGRVARATGRRVDRKERPRDYPRRPRAPRPAGRLRGRPPVRLPSTGDGARRCPGCRRGGPRLRRAARRAASTCPTSTRWRESSSAGRSPRPSRAR